MNLPEIFRARVTELYEQTGLTQEKFAEGLGITTSGLRDILKGRSGSSRLLTLQSIAERHNVSPLWLLGYDDIGEPSAHAPDENLAILLFVIVRSMLEYYAASDPNQGIGALLAEIGGDDDYSGRPWPEMAETLRELQGRQAKEINSLQVENLFLRNLISADHQKVEPKA